MISGYRTNKQKYEELIDYTNNHSDMPEDLKKDIVNVIGRYKILVFCMEEQEVRDLVNKCAKEGTKELLETELHFMISGSRQDYDTAVYNKDRDYDGDENFYNID